MLGFKAFYSGKTTEVYATSSYEAYKKAVEFFKPPKKKTHMVSVVLCEKAGVPVTHSTAE